MKLLVTGGFGFLGSHLVERLLKDDVDVHVVDNLSTSALSVRAFRNAHSARLTFDLAAIAGWAAPFDFDEIYHLASVVGPVGVLSHAGRIVSSVVGDTYRIIGLALRHRARFCDVSTSEIYGGGRNGLCAETDPKIISPKASARLEYATAKLACEIAIINATRAKLWATIVRPFNIAGPRQSAAGGFVLPRFIRQALDSEPLTVYGDGSAIRAFTHVTDVAEGIVRAVRHGISGSAYNIGNPANKTTILDLAQLVLRVTGSASQIQHVDPKELHGLAFEEASDKYPDASLAHAELGWYPKHDLESVVRDATEYIRAGRRD
jgi:UDP-glucose 4-epimerase